MNYLSKSFGLFSLMIMASTTFAAGDYIWEGRFKKELPKAEKGDTKSQYALGEMYEKGKGTEKNTTKAFEWYIKAARKNDHKSAYKVGLFYYKGIAVNLNYKKAHEWFTKSAEEDYARAQYYLGEIYENGRGVSTDNESALKWYKRALAGGYSSASEGIQRVAASQKAGTSRKSTSSKAVKNARSRVLKGGWKKRKRPIEYLPSDVTKCSARGKNLECVSNPLTRNIGMADITYTTKATLFDFEGDDNFSVSYRNNVSKINVTDEEFAETGEKVPVQLGWQDAEHKLSCEFQNDKTIICTKNKVRKIKLTR